MKLSGEATLLAPVDRAYAALHDPAVLVRTIPGCESLERIGPDAYRMVVIAGVAAIKGTYAGEVELTEQRAPHSFVLKASGSGAPGTVSAHVRVRLADAGDGTTTLSYDADAVVGGPVGGVGQRILSGVAKKTADEFFAAVDGLLTAPPEEPSVPTATEVFTRPPTAAVPRTGGNFAVGVAVGAAAALLGVLVGATIARRPGRG
jgi:carbon monoxide dehydrogenase subunit G